VFLRSGTTDAWVFDQVIVREQYKLALPFVPKHIIDAGANIGLTSLYFRHVYPEAAIVAVEPDADNVRILRKNVDVYRNVSVVEGAVWSERGRMRLAVPEDEKCALRVEAGGDSESIEGITIDDILAGQSWDGVDLLKMDIEGAEKKVFTTGAETWLPRVKALVIELHEDVAPGCGKALFQAAADLDYTISWRGENLILLNWTAIRAEMK
jgi:FkbM family methyltransferase